jgi:hypothetical protein
MGLLNFFYKEDQIVMDGVFVVMVRCGRIPLIPKGGKSL